VSVHKTPDLEREEMGTEVLDSSPFLLSHDNKKVKDKGNSRNMSMPALDKSSQVDYCGS
jgi:hypothetical protein